MIDNILTLSDLQAVTASADSTDSYDSGSGIPDLGRAAEHFLVVDVAVDFATCTSIQVVLKDSADDITFAVIATAPAVALADALIGQRLALLAIPQDNRRYLNVGYIIVGSSATAGKVNAYISPDPATS